MTQTRLVPRVPVELRLLLLVALSVRIWVAVSSRFTSEDFLITLRYAENLAHGLGMVYNPGERVLGTTTPLYTLFLAACSVGGLPAVALGKAANILADVATCAMVYRWVRLCGKPRVALLAALVVAANPLQIRWCVSGMETGLATCAGVAACVALAEGRPRLCVMALAVLILLRWDGLLLAGVLGCAYSLSARRVPWSEAALLALLLAPWVVAATAYYGSPIPVTGAAKAAVYGWRFHGQFAPQLGKLATRLAGSPVQAAFMLLVLAGAADVFRRRVGAVVPAAIWVALYFAAFLLSKILLFDWYMVPPQPVFAVLASLGAAWIARRWSGPVAWQRLRVPALLSAGAIVGAAGWATNRSCLETQRVEVTLRAPIGAWLRSQAAPGDRVMLEPIGTIGYTSGMRVLDVVGLVSPEVLPYWRTGRAAPFLDIARRFRPEWCILRPGELKRIEDVAAVGGRPWGADYRLVRAFSYRPSPAREPIVFYAFRRV